MFPIIYRDKGLRTPNPAGDVVAGGCDGFPFLGEVLFEGKQLYGVETVLFLRSFDMLMLVFPVLVLSL